jgi:hypothetical protein
LEALLERLNPVLKQPYVENIGYSGYDVVSLPHGPLFGPLLQGRGSGRNADPDRPSGPSHFCLDLWIVADHGQGMRGNP